VTARLKATPEMLALYATGASASVVARHLGRDLVAVLGALRRAGVTIRKPDPDPVVRFWAKVLKEPGDGCWLWKGSTRHFGYGCFGWQGRIRATHRISYELEHGPIADGLNVLHRCDTPQCVRPSHPFLGTIADNVHDMRQKGRQNDPVGARARTAKLTDADVAELRRQAGERGTGRERYGWLKVWAQRYGVSESTILRAIRGDTWRTVVAA
jgi:hypothetical protein